MPSEITPKFNGKASCFAQFLVEFVGYALLHVKGVDGLHALDDEDSTTWYPHHVHQGEGAAYHFVSGDNMDVDPTYQEQVLAAGVPAYPASSTQAEKATARAATCLAGQGWGGPRG